MITIRCKKHPRYQALRPPRWALDKKSGDTACCLACLQMWHLRIGQSTSLSLILVEVLP